MYYDISGFLRFDFLKECSLPLWLSQVEFIDVKF